MFPCSLSPSPFSCSPLFHHPLLTLHGHASFRFHTASSLLQFDTCHTHTPRPGGRTSQFIQSVHQAGDLIMSLFCRTLRVTRRWLAASGYLNDIISHICFYSRDRRRVERCRLHTSPHNKQGACSPLNLLQGCISCSGSAWPVLSMSLSGTFRSGFTSSVSEYNRF